MNKQERELQMAQANKEKLFRRMQRAYDAGIAVRSGESINNFFTYYALLEETYTEIQKIVDKILNINLDRGSPNALTEYQSLVDTIDEMYCSIKQLAHEHNQNNGTPVIPKSEIMPIPQVQLPKLELKHFDGKLTEWPAFADTFKSLVHNRSDIDNASKFHYLISCLAGPPLSIAKTLPLSAMNYDVIWQMLVEQYQNERVLALDLLDKLFAFKPLTIENPKSLNSFLEDVYEPIASLRHMQLKQLADFLLFYIAFKKLPYDTRKAFEQKYTDVDIPTIDQLFDFVRKQVRVLDISDFNKNVSTPSYSKLRVTHPVKSFTSTTATSIKAVQNCLFCSKPHSIYRCISFEAQHPKERLNWVTNRKICQNCLKPNHKTVNCTSKISCRTCNQRHHTLLHDNFQSEPSTSVTSCHSLSKTTVILGTAMCQVLNRRGALIDARALLDSGSMSSFITLSMVKSLGIRYKKQDIPISAIDNNASSGLGTTTCSIRSKLHPDVCISVDVIIVNSITSLTPSRAVSKDVIQRFSDLRLADPSYHLPGPIDILFGADLFAEIIKDRKIIGKPSAIDSIFGWVIMGASTNRVQSSEPVVNLMNHVSLDKLLTRFWSVEEPPSKNIINEQDLQAEELFKSQVSLTNGRFNVPILRTEDFTKLGDSYNLALSRFYNLERRLQRQPELKLSYVKFMREYFELKHMSLTTMPASYIIPHHCVFKHNNSAKLRVVFDASMKTTTNLSLNDVLFTGPKLHNEICGIMSRFRLHEYVIVTDICKMYRQISVLPEDRIYQNILWRESPDLPIQQYQLNTVTYGLRSSPFLALRCLQHLASLYVDEYPLAVKALQQDVYVDDIVTGSSGLEETISLQRQLSKLLSLGGFQLKKWASNNIAVLTDVPNEHQQPDVTFDDSDKLCINILGFAWNSSSDIFKYNVQDISTDTLKSTKRAILSHISRLFDPLGWIAPVIFFAKHIIQQLWQLGLQWDEQVPEPLHSQWLTFCTQLQTLSKVNISRKITNAAKSYRLIGFADASQKGYGAVTYLQPISQTSSESPCLLMAKSKVAPLKLLSIPRLELQAAVMLTKILSYQLEQLGPHLSIKEVIAFTDSTVTLSWIRTPPYKLKTFVAHRVMDIINAFPVSIWYYISTSDNAADIASRGCYPSEIINHDLWWNGPEWIHKPKDLWPCQTLNILSGEDIPELRSSEVVNLTIQPLLENEIILRFSSLPLLTRVIARILRLRHLFKAQECAPDLKSCLTTKELQEALEVAVKLTQQVFFKEEFTALQRNSQSSLSLLKLRPFIDDRGLIRVGGRLVNSSLKFSNRHPLVLPKGSHFTKILIRHYHERYLHAGPSLVQALIQRQFWILSARSAIRKVLHSCVKCFKTSPRAIQPMMAPLPSSRVTFTRPFLKTGVDFAGPFSIRSNHKRGNSLVGQAYLCVFVCFATKALHLECVSSLSSEAFLAALDRFTSRRGLITDMYSDCGRNFVGASRYLSDMYKFLSRDPQKSYINAGLLERQITWHFNPPSAPHFGGLWEAGVKSVKTHIKRVIGTQILTFEEYTTLFCKIESILNSRPLCPLSSDPSETEPLTPGHFLTGSALHAIPEYDFEKIPNNRLSRWQLIQKCAQDLWRRWHLEYLHTLMSRTKWHGDCADLKVDDIVVIKDTNVPPLCWPTGRITAVHSGSDGVVRVATVRTKTGLYQRPSNKLCRLPNE